jgi:hypothetical protein
MCLRLTAIENWHCSVEIKNVVNAAIKENRQMANGQSYVVTSARFFGVFAFKRTSWTTARIPCH